MKREHPSWTEGYTTLVVPVTVFLFAPWFVGAVVLMLATLWAVVRWSS